VVESEVFTKIDSEMGFMGGGNSSSSSGSSPFCSSSFGNDLVASLTGDYRNKTTHVLIYLIYICVYINIYINAHQQKTKN